MEESGGGSGARGIGIEDPNAFSLGRELVDALGELFEGDAGGGGVVGEEEVGFGADVDEGGVAHGVAAVVRWTRADTGVRPSKSFCGLGGGWDFAFEVFAGDALVDAPGEESCAVVVRVDVVGEQVVLAL